MRSQILVVVLLVEGSCKSNYDTSDISEKIVSPGGVKELIIELILLDE